MAKLQKKLFIQKNFFGKISSYITNNESINSKDKLRGTMLKLGKTLLLLTAILTCSLSNMAEAKIPFFMDLEDLNLSGSKEDPYKDLTTPDPFSLHPQWWHYYDVDGNDLAQRITGTAQSLQNIYKTLSFDEQEAVSPLINSFNTNLNALPSAKKQKNREAPVQPPFHKTYTLGQQLELNQKIRKLKVNIKTEQEELEQLSERISKAQTHIDTLMAAYLGEGKMTTKRLVKGLELMVQQAALGIAQENLQAQRQRIDHQILELDHLEQELEAAKGLLDVSVVNENQLNQEIQFAERDLETKQIELVRAEANSLGSLGDNAQDHATKNLLTQRVVHAAASKSLAWAKLAFQKLKFNLILHLNKRFNASNSEMREKLHQWKEHLEVITHQVKEWEKAALREQDRMRQDYAFLAAQSDIADPKLMRINQARRQESSETLTTLQRLNEEIANVQWLVYQMEYHIIAQSSLIEKWWGDIVEAVTLTWERLMNWLNISLFKINGIPITLLTIFRIVMILLITISTSIVVRVMVKAFGVRRPHVTHTNLYNMGRLSHYLVLLIGAIIALCSIGLDFGNLMIILGALTFGIGFGLQSIATNFLCGLRILFERKIKIGDYIELTTGHKGKVTEIHVQNTVICTSEGIEIVIPNSELLSAPLVNWTMNNDFRRLHIPFGVSYNSDKEHVRKVVSKAAKRVPCTLLDSDYGDPQVWLVKFGDDALEFELVVWVNYKMKSFTDSKEADYLWEIETALRENHIELPLNTQLLYLKHIKDSTYPTPGYAQALEAGSMMK